ncbi:MAG: EamA family transporter [Alphaproteobacteria bacterium]|nr:EamA family transporter [Alphaproteobacteria bacterium]
MTRLADTTPVPPPKAALDKQGRRRAWRRRMAGRWAALPANTRGALWMLLAATGFSGMAVLVKVLGQSLDSFQVAFFRCVVGLAVLTPFALAAGPAGLRTQAPHLHAGRAVFGVTAMMCGFYAFTHLPLATATAITFAKPLFLIVIAVLFLGEVVRWRRWSATLAGFAGVLIMLRPGPEGFDPAMLVALGQAMAVAGTVVFVKKMPAGERHLAILFWFAAISTAVALVPALLVWRWPSGEEWALAGLMGLLGVGSQAAVVRAYRTGEATAVAPFDYSRLLVAALFGFLVFAEVPDVWTIAGAAVIVGSTVYIARREATLGRQPPGPAPH